MLEGSSRIVEKEVAALDTILMAILTACIAALIVRLMTPVQQPPTVIYVQPEPTVEQGTGCLPIAAVAIALVIILSLVAS
jgi:hypothetical protein